MSKLAAIVLVVLNTSLPASAVLGHNWQIAQITDESQFVRNPKISGSTVVWEQFDGQDWEIFLFDGSTTTQLTNNEVWDWLPDVSNGHVAWVRGESDETAIVYDGQIIVEGIQTPADMALEPGGLLWSMATAPDFVSHVYLYDGLTTKRLSVDGTESSHNPDMSGDKVVWSSFNNLENSAYLYDGTTSVELPENVGLGQVPKISGNNIVGVGIGSAGDSQIFLYDGVTNSPIGNTIGADTSPDIAGQSVAWLSEVNDVYEVFTYQNGQAKQLSFDSERTFSPFVSESFVFFNAQQGNDFEIFVYDGVTTVQITDNDVQDFLHDITDNAFVWTSYDGESSQIFTATFVVPEPNAGSLLLAVLICLSNLRISQRRKRTHCKNICRRCAAFGRSTSISGGLRPRLSHCAATRREKLKLAKKPKLRLDFRRDAAA